MSAKRYDYVRDPAEITRRSFAILADEPALAGLPPDIAPVAARIVHACGMPDVARDLACSAGAAAVGRAALAAGAPILCDVRMVAAGLMTKRLSAANAVHVAIDQPGAAELAARSGQTRSAAGMELLADRFAGAILVIGNAPTALFRLLELVADGAARPALVLGFPVGFVGAAESKAALVENDLGLPFVALTGRRGGSAMAAAAVNALILGDRLS
jgi:precorrin-8X/cobalt-precorrin-8 methylmutase